MGGVRLADGRVIITGLSGTVLVSRDGGHNFTYYRHPGRKDIVTPVAPDGKTVLLIGQFGVQKLQMDGLSVKR